MKKFFLPLILLAALIVFGLSFNFAQAKSKKPFVFITYEGKSSKKGACQQTTNDQVNLFGAAGWRLQPGITNYYINYSTKPKTSNSDTVRSAVEQSFNTIQNAGGGQLFANAGSGNERKPINNGQNTVMWSPLPAGMVAMTYIWSDNGRLVDADTVFNSRYRWSYTSYNGSNDCGGLKSTFDLQDIGTHEFGHWVGLGDIYDTQGKDLTMYGIAYQGELKKDTLGLGDITGVRALWP